MEFSKGPWRWDYDDTNGQPVVCGEIEICTCWHHSVGAILKEARANASLIAAAPELYEALERCRDACLFPEDGEQIGVSEDAHIPSELFDQMCKALAKARGEQ